MTHLLKILSNHLQRPVDILPLCLFRAGFGGLMLFSTMRFIASGWVDEFYIDPIFHFTYYGFDWITPAAPEGMRLLFVLLVLFSILITIGLFYRVSIVSFFVIFTYIELIDKAYYLNHYYLISVMSLLMIFLPLNRKFAVDSWRHPEKYVDTVPAWMLYTPRLLLAIVYFYAGLSKLTPDWLLHALPMRIWLPASAGVPLVGRWTDDLWLAYLISWGGAIYDLCIPFGLAWRRTRLIAYMTVVGFHLTTALLFSIGVFPCVMIVCTLIFFDAEVWYRVGKFLRIPISPTIPQEHQWNPSKLLRYSIGLFFIWQLLFPLRHVLYPGNHHWTNEGFRFAWHVMLIEKSGIVEYRVEDNSTGRFWIIYPADYLSPQQVQQMSIQPDMIVQFAHFLASEYRPRCDCDLAVYADTYVSLNLRPGQTLLDPERNLADVAVNLHPADWIIPLHG